MRSRAWPVLAFSLLLLSGCASGGPLDILYFDNARRLVTQQRNVPPCSGGDRCPAYPSDRPARFVLELNAGEAERLKLRDGAELTFGEGIPPVR